MLQVRKKSSYNLRRSRDSRVRIRLFCPRRSSYWTLRVQIAGFCPRRLSCMLSRTAARARSAQGASQFAAGYAAVRLWTGPHGANLQGKCSPVFPLTIDVWKRKCRGRSAALQDITAEMPVNFGTNEHLHKAAKIIIIYWAIDCYADFNSLSNMLTPIKN